MNYNAYILISITACFASTPAFASTLSGNSLDTLSYDGITLGSTLPKSLQKAAEERKFPALYPSRLHCLRGYSDGTGSNEEVRTKTKYLRSAEPTKEGIKELGYKDYQYLFVRNDDLSLYFDKDSYRIFGMNFSRPVNTSTTPAQYAELAKKKFGKPIAEQTFMYGEWRHVVAFAGPRTLSDKIWPPKNKTFSLEMLYPYNLLEKPYNEIFVIAIGKNKAVYIAMNDLNGKTDVPKHNLMECRKAAEKQFGNGGL